MLQWRHVNVKPHVLDQSSAAKQFLRSSSIDIKYMCCACVGEIIVEISDVESPLHPDLDVALLDVAVVYRFRFSRRDRARLGSAPFTILLAHTFLSLTLFILSPPAPTLSAAACFIHGAAELVSTWASNVGIRYAINDGRLLFAYAGSIDTPRRTSGSIRRFRFIV